MEKHEWRKQEKQYYLPKPKPERIRVPEFKFALISGEGNPNSPFFAECISALYAFSYSLKMGLKKMDNPPGGYVDYTVYPLEGIWDIKEEARARNVEGLNKDDLVFKLMIRQPDFIDNDLFAEALEKTKKKKPNAVLNELVLKSITDGECIQMLHRGSFDDEPASFQKMEDYAEEQGLRRLSKKHREIYLSDFRKVAPEKLKTVLRFQLA